MARDPKLSDKEAAFLAAAKRGLADKRGEATPPAPAPSVPRSASRAAAKPVPDKAMTSAERMAQLMAAEAEENRRRIKRDRLWLIGVPVALLALVGLSLLLGGRRKR